MSTLTPPRHRPRPDVAATPAPAMVPARRGPVISDDLLTLALGALMLAAILPLSRVFVGSEWIRPVAGGVLLALGIAWGARRLSVGPLTHLLMTALSLLVFLTIAFLPDTAVVGLLPTPATLVALWELFGVGLELVELRPSPTPAEAGLLLLAVGGTWTVTYLADGMLFVMRSPLRAIACGVVMWSVPLAVAPQSTDIALPAVTLLGAAAFLLLLGNTITAAAFGVSVPVPGADGRPRTPTAVPVPGVMLAFAAILAGLLFAQVLPGFADDPLYQTRGGSGTTITTNPIVDIKARLVASDTGPVLMVDSPRPVYLRTTALDRYDEFEQWTAGTISGNRVQGTIDTAPAVQIEPIDVGVEIADSIEAGAVLAPAPYQPIEVTGPKAEVLRYDPASSTLTTPGDASLVAGDTYHVRAAIPQPPAEALRTVPLPGQGAPYTELPDNVPPEVVALARQIVNESGAATMFDAALAVQDHLRRWTYSTQPEPGLGATAMTRFIDAQQGYCEQFAGTMAVMLRTLGIPTRLAVGYTPGDLQADGRWLVTNANAHAWVEVHFADLGWVSFEPTPRSDGNVLVTSAQDVVPARTQAQVEGREPGPGDPVGPGELGALRPTGAPAFPEGDPFGAPVPGSATADGPGATPWLAALAVVVLAVAAAGVMAWRRSSISGHLTPAERITEAGRRVQRTATALGRPRRPSETDGEYFARIAEGRRIGRTLAQPVTRAVFAPAVDATEAAGAEQAADTLVQRLTEDLSRRQRMVVALRIATARARA